MSGSGGRERDGELLRDLLSDELGIREHAASVAIDEHLLDSAGSAAIVVVRPLRGRKPILPSDAATRWLIDDVLTQTCDRIDGRRTLHLVRPDHAVLVVTSMDDVDDVATIAAAARDDVRAALGDDDEWRVVVGIGDPAAMSDLRRSYDEARRTAEVCTVLPAAGPVARWSDLGVYQILLQLPLSDVSVGSLHPGLSRLLTGRDARVWLTTLETYLDLGCDARGTAGALGINRSTLYHRIHRIEEIAGVDLSTGDDRLVLHLGLKLARLNGLLD